jgi:hypothetical protein
MNKTQNWQGQTRRLIIEDAPRQQKLQVSKWTEGFDYEPQEGIETKTGWQLVERLVALRQAASHLVIPDTRLMQYEYFGSPLARKWFVLIHRNGIYIIHCLPLSRSFGAYNSQKLASELYMLFY